MANTETAEQKLERVMAENAALRNQVNGQSAGRLSFKVTEPRKAGTNGPEDKGTDGGAVSVYGLGRFPVTLYKEQWERLIAGVTELQGFMKTNVGKLKTKADKVITKAAA